MPRRIDGNNAIYHYLQKVIVPREDDFSRELIRRMILDLSIWFPVELYRAVPVLLPFCVRDSSVRSKEWGSANAQGCMRDNNSALKLLVVNYTIQSPRPEVYPRSSRGHGFVASHAWRRIRIDECSQYSTGHPRTYSFVPNLAWLPAQVAKLTDHEGSYAQQVLQSISAQLYHSAAEQHPGFLASIWDSLPAPDLDIEVDPRQLSYFGVSGRAITIRRNNLIREIQSVEETISQSKPVGRSPRSFRYLSTLSQVQPQDCTGLLAWLGDYRRFLGG